MLHNEGMKCPKCNSISPRKNGHRRGKQCYQCRVCGRQFSATPNFVSVRIECHFVCLIIY